MRVPLLIFCMTLLAATCCAQDESKPPFERLGTVKSKLINESSGLVRASFGEGYFWTLNDSGNAAELYLIAQTGEHKATLKLNGAKNLDWESMTSFTRSGIRYLLVGDVGDNGRRRKSCSLYWFAEPEFVLRKEPVTQIAVTPRQIEFTYSDGPRDCEAIAVDSTRGRLWLVEKIFIDDRRRTVPGVYSMMLPTSQKTKKTVAKRVADYPARNVTGMDISDDGKRMLVRTYIRAHWFERNENQKWDEVFRKFKPELIAVPLQRQGEAICLSGDAKSAFVTSEARRQPIWKIDLVQQLELQRKQNRPKSKK